MPEDRGLIQTWMSKLLGASWQTSLSGIVAIISLYIHQHPEVVHWISEPLQGIIWNISEYIFYASIGTLAWRSKDKMLTGGSTQQTLKGNLAEPGTQTMVDATVRASIDSNEPVTADQRAAVQERKLP